MSSNFSFFLMNKLTAANEKKLVSKIPFFNGTVFFTIKIAFLN
jgi:hypothetical protein